ncbi:hypothetical protein AB6813_16975 [bacterium RCC_150]
MITLSFFSHAIKTPLELFHLLGGFDFLRLAQRPQLVKCPAQLRYLVRDPFAFGPGHCGLEELVRLIVSFLKAVD